MTDACLESDAFATFQLHRNDVYRWAQRVVGGRHDALDVLQDVFLRWVDQCQILEPQYPRAWLRRVTVNRAIDTVRGRRTQPLGEVATRHAASGGGDPLEREELQGAIASALADLTEHQRQVMVAKVFDGMTFSAIATELDLAVPTVKTHYLRALAGVRDRLSDDFNPSG